MNTQLEPMHRRRLVAAICLIGLVQLTAACKSGGTAGPAVEEGGGSDETQVRQAVEAFYADYIDQTTLDDATGTVQNPLIKDYAYRDDARLDAALVEQIDGLVEKAGEEGLSADPFLCAAQVPERADVDTVEVKDKAATAKVYTRFPDSPIPFRMTLSLVKGDDGTWKLAQIQCK